MKILLDNFYKMKNILKNPFLKWISRIFDISWSIWKKEIENIKEKYINYWFEMDRENISSDFKKIIK
jgi:hypothetical protein